MFVLLFMMSMVGATSADGCTTEPYGACGAARCPTGQTLMCGTTCATPVAVNVVGACSLNPCASNGICADGATCVPTGTGNSGTCTKIANTEGGSTTALAAPCDPLARANGVPFDSCANDTYCKNMVTCAPTAYRQDPAQAQYRCAIPQSEGEDCDSDDATYDPGSKCLPCEPGLTCRQGKTGDTKRCFRDCTADADCPCPLGNAGKCKTLSDGSKACTTCGSLGASCNSYTSCCNASDACSSSTGAGTCCRTNGAPCTTVDDCCASGTGQNPTVCGTSGTGKACLLCVGSGGSCSNSDQCCGGGTCTSGTCRFSCTNNTTPCQVTGKQGACKMGHYACDAGGHAICVQSVFPTTETCDNVDNDCNGVIDDGLAKPVGACTGPSTQSGNNCGSATFTGALICKNGSTQCQVTKEAYCTGPGDPECGLAEGQPCGSPGSALCGLNSACVAGFCARNQACTSGGPTCYPHNSPSLGVPTPCLN